MPALGWKEGLEEGQGSTGLYSHPGSQAARCTSPRRLGLSKHQGGSPLGSPGPGCLQHHNSEEEADTEMSLCAGFDTKTQISPSSCCQGHCMAVKSPPKG